MASVLDVKKRAGQGRFCTLRDQLASIRSTGLAPTAGSGSVWEIIAWTGKARPSTGTSYRSPTISGYGS